ncbi:hypothetical protein [Salibacterium aidingense]|uniref:hypothetical protein n=1 Tax=Salibacterium aidingense TaxID=384933 RepID=UPI000418DB7B|nr:hypothetical protein [Salibacterium aidingense]
MALSRQDAWSADEDITLAEIVLRHVREGSTQLSAFQEAGEKLSRTAAACGFRWNACIRKKYESAIEMARTHKHKSTDKGLLAREEEQQPDIPLSNIKDPGLSNEEENFSPHTAEMKNQLQDTISFLTKLSQYMEEKEAEVNNTLENKKKELQHENKKLEEELHQVKKDFKRLREDYKALLDVMEKARALSEGALPYLAEEEMEESS